MKTVFGRTSILGGLCFAVVLTRWSSILLKNPFCHSSIHPFLQNILVLTLYSIVRHGTEWIASPNSSENLCLLFCLFLLLWLSGYDWKAVWRIQYDLMRILIPVIVADPDFTSFVKHKKIRSPQLGFFFHFSLKLNN